MDNLIEMLFLLFEKENTLGPSIYTQYVEEEKKPLTHDIYEVETEFDIISNKTYCTFSTLIMHSYIEQEGQHRQELTLICLTEVLRERR